MVQIILNPSDRNNALNVKKEQEKRAGNQRDHKTTKQCMVSKGVQRNAVEEGLYPLIEKPSSSRLLNRTNGNHTRQAAMTYESACKQPKDMRLRKVGLGI